MPNYMLFGEPIGQSWVQLSELALAFLLSALIGLEREIRQESAGLRTYTLVGVSSGLIENGRVVLDPSRVAAQIVTGIGFIGGGVIFVRKDLVRGLTTASIVWLTAVPRPPRQRLPALTGGAIGASALPRVRSPAPPPTVTSLPVKTSRCVRPRSTPSAI